MHAIKATYLRKLETSLLVFKGTNSFRKGHLVSSAVKRQRLLLK